MWSYQQIELQVSSVFVIALFVLWQNTSAVNNDKIFVTDVLDSKIFYQENSGDAFNTPFNELNVSGLQAPVGIDFDPRHDMVYWTDEEARTINRAALDGSFQEVLIGAGQGIGYPQGIVLDLVEDKMFWSDTLLERIESANLDGSNKRTIINTNLYLPWSVALSQIRGKLFWTDESNTVPKIEMCNKDGTSRRTIVTSNLKEPNGLALDHLEQRLYWTESYYDVIESIDLDDLSDRRKHVTSDSSVLVFFGISLYYDSIYFTDLASSGLYVVDVKGGDWTSIGSIEHPSHVKVYANLTCPDSLSCSGNTRCQMVAYDTPGCVCLRGYRGPDCEPITCPSSSLPTDTSLENSSTVYEGGARINVVCDNGADRSTWTCDRFTGNWQTSTPDCAPIDHDSNLGYIIGPVVLGSILLGLLIVYAGCKKRCKRTTSTPPSTVGTQNRAPSVSAQVSEAVHYSTHVYMPVQ